MDLQQRGMRDRPDRIHAFGMLEAESAPLPSRDHQERDLPLAKRLLAARLMVRPL